MKTIEWKDEGDDYRLYMGNYGGSVSKESYNVEGLKRAVHMWCVVELNGTGAIDSGMMSSLSGAKLKVLSIIDKRIK